MNREEFEAWLRSADGKFNRVFPWLLLIGAVAVVLALLIQVLT